MPRLIRYTYVKIVSPLAQPLMGPQKNVANNSLLYSIYVTTYNRPFRRPLVNHIAHKNHPKAGVRDEEGESGEGVVVSGAQGGGIHNF
jgi:hypothetical protein